MNQIKVIITGSTGMVGEGVLLECINNPKVEKILLVNRKHFEITHSKVEELIVEDFMNVEDHVDKFSEFHACFFCAGISSIGINEEKYTKITYDTTMHFAKTMYKSNPNMVFNYVSGSGTESSEKGRLMWARVKGKTENDLMKIGFRGQYNFRPGFMKHVHGQKNVKFIFKFFSLFFPALFPQSSLTLNQVGNAMINSVITGYDKKILEISDIKKLGI